MPRGNKLPKSPLSRPDHTPVYDWSDEERAFVGDMYSRFLECYTARTTPLPLLGGMSIEDMWNNSELDYAVVLSEMTHEENDAENNPVRQYQSTVSRDKSNVYIAHITSNMMYSDVVAQHPEQGIDRLYGRVGSSLLYWAYRNDGWPSESGQQKNARLAHSMVVRGTAFTLDVVTKDGLESEEIPCDELYIQNAWQPNIQKQPQVYRAKLNMTWGEAEAAFGHLKNFKFVPRNSWTQYWVVNTPILKDLFSGIIWADRCTAIYVWKQATQDELKYLKKIGKVKKSAKRACIYNLVINGIPMFDVWNVSPYRHGYYPISKGIFEEFARSEFFWGNSCPNKMREDKRWKDAWKTLMRFKGKLGALKPQLIIGGSLDEQIVLPAAQTSVPEGIDVKAVEGVADGVSQADINLMTMADTEIDRSSVTSSTAGQRPDERQTARAEMVQAANAAKMLEPFLQQFGFFMQARSFHVLLSLLQFIPKRSIKKIAIPDQTLSDGLHGTFEIIFQKPTITEPEEFLQESFKVRDEQTKSRKTGAPKDIVYVNPEYLDEIKFYLFSDATAGMQDKNLLRAADFQKDLELFLGRSDLFVPSEVAREYVHMKGYNERILAGGQMSPNKEQVPGQLPGANGDMQGTLPATEADAVASNASQAAVGAPMGNLPS